MHASASYTSNAFHIAKGGVHAICPCAFYVRYAVVLYEQPIPNGDLTLSDRIYYLSYGTDQAKMRSRGAPVVRLRPFREIGVACDPGGKASCGLSVVLQMRPLCSGATICKRRGVDEQVAKIPSAVDKEGRDLIQLGGDDRYLREIRSTASCGVHPDRGQGQIT